MSKLAAELAALRERVAALEDKSKNHAQRSELVMFPLRMSNSIRDLIRAAAAASGLSMNQFIMQVVAKRLTEIAKDARS